MRRRAPNLVDVEIAILSAQCLDGRIPDREALMGETAFLEKEQEVRRP